MKMKEESEKFGLKLNIQKTKIMVSWPIISWQINGETVAEFIFMGSEITADGDFPSSHVRMWELDYKEGWAPKNWCFWIVVLEKTLESPLDCKEIQPVHPKGNQSWIFIRRTDVEAETPIFWPPDLKRPWCWERLRAGEEGDDRG